MDAQTFIDVSGGAATEPDKFQLVYQQATPGLSFALAPFAMRIHGIYSIGTTSGGTIVTTNGATGFANGQFVGANADVIAYIPSNVMVILGLNFEVAAGQKVYFNVSSSGATVLIVSRSPSAS